VSTNLSVKTATGSIARFCRGSEEEEEKKIFLGYRVYKI
jgi:hypothetical protein